MVWHLPFRFGGEHLFKLLRYAITLAQKGKKHPARSCHLHLKKCRPCRMSGRKRDATTEASPSVTLLSALLHSDRESSARSFDRDVRLHFLVFAYSSAVSDLMLSDDFFPTQNIKSSPLSSSMFGFQSSSQRGMAFTR
jgi:hypothetical protein